MFTVVAGVKTHFQRMGQGPVLVLLHGWGCDWQIWSPIIGPLSEDFQLVIPDLPAFGQSETPTQTWNSEKYVAWLAEFIRQISPEKPATIVGHSFGGKIAALLAAQADAAISDLVLVDSSGLPDPISFPKQIQKIVLGLIPSEIKNLIPRSTKEKILTATGSATDYYHSSTAQRKIFNQILTENISSSLKKITTPTLLIWGENDIDTPLHQAEQFKQYISNSELIIFDNAAHFPFIDQPAAFVASLTQFLDHA